MKRSMIAAGALSLLVGAVLFSPAGVFAYQGDPNVKGPNYTEERHAAMTKAFESKDFSAWKNLMQGRGRVTQVVNQSNFARFAQAHQSGDTAKIRAELGLGLRNGSGQGQKNGSGQGLHNGTGSFRGNK